MTQFGFGRLEVLTQGSECILNYLGHEENRFQNHLEIGNRNLVLFVRNGHARTPRERGAFQVGVWARAHVARAGMYLARTRWDPHPQTRESLVVFLFDLSHPVEGKS